MNSTDQNVLSKSKDEFYNEIQLNKYHSTKGKSKVEVEEAFDQSKMHSSIEVKDEAITYCFAKNFVFSGHKHKGFYS